MNRTAFSAADDDMIRKMWKAGEAASKIAIAIGRDKTRMAILGRIRRLGLKRNLAGSGPTRNNPVKVPNARARERAILMDKLVDLHERGLSSPQAADVLGIGPTVVLECWKLLREQGRIEARERVKPPPPRRVPPRNLSPPPRAGGVAPATKAPRGALAAVIALTIDTCRFPMGEPTDAEFHFCMAPVSDPGLRPYCREHERLASGGKP